MHSDLLEILQRRTGLNQSEVSRIIATAPNRYKQYEIDKRSGGKRTIAQPAREVKDMQRIIVDRILSRFPIHPAATAYRKGQSILSNAEAHQHNPAILKMDFKDFFGSIKESDFSKTCAYHQLGLPPADDLICRQLLFWRKEPRRPLCLSIGAPSSPVVSNIVMYRFDEIVADICSSIDVIYTRYADDLTFSSSNSAPLRIIEKKLSDILGQLSYPILYINHSKTILVTKRSRRTVTGLVITNDGKVSLGREKKRELRAAIHAFAQGNLDENEIEKTRGLLAYSNSVEPEFFGRMKEKYGEQLIALLMGRPLRRTYVITQGKKHKLHTQ